MGIVISARNNQEFASTTAQKASFNHSAYHMADDPRFYEPQRLNNFEIIITGLDNLTKAGMEATDSDAALGSGSSSTIQEALRLSVKSTSVPKFSISPITVKRGNSSIKYSNVAEFGSGSLVINDFIGLEAREALYAWQQLAYNTLTQKVGVAQDYKKTCYLQEYTPDTQLVRTWKMVGCWVSDIDDGTFSYDDSGVHTCSATLQYDYAVIDRSE